MIYGSVCSGIEAATAAWHLLGWTPKFFAEIEKFPSAVLAHHYGSNMPGEPLSTNGVPNHGDFTKIGADAGPVDLLVGGTPCQSFSVAGKRLGLDDPRGNLALEFLALARRLRARWIVWENVPGVLSSRSDDGSHDFATFLSFVLQCGYGFAYRVLDAQYVRVDGYPFAVPQRRRRVFVVGYLGDWRPAAAALFEPEGLRGHPAPRRKAGQGIAAKTRNGPDGGSGCSGKSGSRLDNFQSQQKSRGAASDENTTRHGGLASGKMGAAAIAEAQEVAPTISRRPTGGGGLGTDFDLDGGLIANSGDASFCLCVNGQRSNDLEVETLIAHAPPSAATLTRGAESSGKGGYAGRRQEDDHNIVAIQERAVSENPDAGPDGAGVRTDGAAYTLEARTVPQAVAFDIRGREGGSVPEGPHDTANIRAGSGGSSRSYVAQPWAVRRLSARECERLQGFPDDFTRISWRGKEAEACPDGPRYKALGNSMAVNVMRWIGMRIQMVEDVLETQKKKDAAE